jgi:hypothetical protein
MLAVMSVWLDDLLCTALLPCIVGAPEVTVAGYGNPVAPGRNSQPRADAARLLARVPG